MNEYENHPLIIGIKIATTVEQLKSLVSRNCETECEEEIGKAAVTKAYELGIEKSVVLIADLELIGQLDDARPDGAPWGICCQRDAFGDIIDSDNGIYEMWGGSMNPTPADAIRVMLKKS